MQCLHELKIISPCELHALDGFCPCWGTPTRTALRDEQPLCLTLAYERQHLDHQLQRTYAQRVNIEPREVLKTQRRVRAELSAAIKELHPRGNWPITTIPTDIQVVPSATSIRCHT